MDTCLRYDQPFTGISGLTAAPAQKAGNISQIASRVRGREAQIMSYSYDYLSRLSSSTFRNYSDAGVISGTNNYNENLSYDLRGNIQTLQRTGFYTNGSTCTYGQIDNLTYSYTANTNRLHKVLDGTLTAGDAKSRGFNGLLSTVDNSMTYDRNGNLNKNLHKNVSTISYNHLNLPIVITFTTGNTIEMLYDASGNKLRKTVKVGATVQYVQDYLPGGIEYRQTGTGVKRVESVFHAEGRYYNTNVDVSSTLAWRKEYNMKDHLGNTRLVFTDRNANGIVDITGTASTSDVLQENHYYAFGLAFEGAWLQNDATARDNAYQYNGKELNDDFGLNLYAYGARYYDPTIGRFTGVDPISDKFPFVSTFNYAENNPIVNIDLHGLQGLHYMETMENGTRRHVIEKNIVVLTQQSISTPSNADEKMIRKNERQNKKIDNANKNKLNSTKELEEFYNGMKGNEARNSAGEQVFFKFNIIEEKVADTKSMPLAKEISRKYGLKSSLTTSSGKTVNVPSAVMTDLPTKGSQGLASGNVVHGVPVSSPRGTLSHEVGHTLTLDDSYGGDGRGFGLMGSPPSQITPEEVDRVIQKSYKRDKNEK